MSSLPRFAPMAEYLALPREPQPWIIKNLIPVGGLVNCYGKPKCFALATPLLTQNRGWITVGEVVQGDLVFGFHGQPVEVVEVHPIYTDHQCYRLKFTDGTELVADADHEWLVDDHVETTQTIYHKLLHGQLWGLIPKGGAIEWDGQLLDIGVEHVKILSVTPVESVPVRCFEVASEDHLIRIGRGLTTTFNSGKSWLALAWAKAIAAGDSNWCGYEIPLNGPVAYLQVDTPREEWSRRLELVREQCQRANIPLWIADMWLVPRFPVNVLEPDDPTLEWLRQQMAEIQPVLVVVDTLREVHGGDEDSSTVMRNVISSLVGVCRPAAIVFVSHARKDQAGWQQGGGDDDMMDQNRGSSYTSGRMDVIVKVTQKRMQFKGRATGLVTEQLQQDKDTGWIELVRDDDGSAKEIEAIWKAHPEGLSVHRMAELLSKKKGYSLSTATRRIKEWNDSQQKKET